MDRQWAVPNWEGSVFQKWAKKWCAENHWRVRNILGDYEDCLQECYMQYLYCREHYPNVAPNHFNYMFMLAVRNVFDTASKKDFDQREAYRQLPRRIHGYNGEAELAAKLSGASEELKAVMQIFLNAPKEVMDTLRTETQTRNHPKQFWQSVVKLAGIQLEKASSLAKELQKLLTN